MNAAALQEAIEQRLAQLGGAIVAFSGGVDSSVVAALAARALGDRALAVTAVSPALAQGELEGAGAVAAAAGIAHEVVTTAELARPGYRANGPDRCFHCKSELYEHLAALARERRIPALLSGANADDVGDWRPGLRAAAAQGVVHPLLEAGAGKEEVRAMARRLGLPSAEKPASPCLASRIPYGTPVDAGTLEQIDRAERALRDLGFRELRVRHFGRMGRVELSRDDLERARRSETLEEVEAAVRRAGYERARVQPAPLRSGALSREAGLG